MTVTSRNTWQHAASPHAARFRIATHCAQVSEESGMTHTESAEIFVRKVMAIFGQELDTETFRETVRKVLKAVSRKAS